MEPSNIAIVPGSFDPITNGHVDIVRRAAEQYDKVYLAVMVNPEKQYMFTMEQRTEIARAALCDIPKAEVISSRGMLWKLAEDLGACAIVKGIRNEVDRAYEEKMAEFNLAHNPKAKTVLLLADPALTQVSSTAVRKKIENHESLEGMLPPKAIRVLEQMLVP